MGQPMPGGYPPMPFRPPPPPPGAPRSKMPGWAIAVVVVGSLVALTCFGGMTAVLVRGLGNSDPRPPRAIGEDPFGGSRPGLRPSPSPSSVAPLGPPPADRTYTGSGDKTVQIKLDPQWTYIARVTHDGQSNFVIQSRGSRNEYVDLVVNAIGDYNGLRLLNVRRDRTPTSLRIRARGTWKVTTQVSDKAPRWTGKASGTGETVLRVDPAQPESSAGFSHRGSGACSLFGYGDGATALLANDIGRFSNQVSIEEGTRFLDISTDGPWTLTKSK